MFCWKKSQPVNEEIKDYWLKRNCSYCAPEMKVPQCNPNPAMNTCETCKHQHYSYMLCRIACKRTGEIVFVDKTDTCEDYEYIWSLNVESDDNNCVYDGDMPCIDEGFHSDPTCSYKDE